MSAASAAAAAKGELRFDGRVAVVTGAGGGLGRAYALLLASRGAKVVVNDMGGSVAGQGKDMRAADRVVEEIRAAGGFAVAEYSSVEAGGRIIDAAISAFGRVDILICNAGILRDVSFTKMNDAAWDAVLGVHLRGSYACARAAWPHMRERGYGRIIFVCSSSGIYGNFGQANYAAAKMGILGLANTLSREGVKRGILVNTVAPIAASRMTESVMPPDLLAVLKPEAVAPVVAYLCHESCTTTGAVYEVGGGWTARLRWQRSKGAFFPVGRGTELTAEAVRDAWARVGDFDDGASYPDSTQSSFEPIMANLRPAEELPTATSTDNPAAQAAAQAVALGNTSKGSFADVADADVAARWLQPMPGGNTGGSDAVDVSAALAHRFKPVQHTYTERDVALYALSIGASKEALNPDDLRFTYELHASGLRVYPTFGVLFPHSGMADLTSMPALRFNPMMLLHGEQELVLPKGSLPIAASVTTRGRISNIYDKGSGAVVMYTAVTTDQSSGAVLAVNRSSVFIRGIGGFGGDRGPAPPAWSVPSRKPDAEVSVTTPDNAALLYRLNGDTNPLHADPDMASLGGFSRPILHGLCTFGIAGRALLHAFGGGDPASFRSIRARFSKHVFPGDTVVVQAWRVPSDGAAGVCTRVHFTASVQGRGETVLSNGVAEFVTGSDAAPLPRL